MASNGIVFFLVFKLKKIIVAIATEYYIVLITHDMLV